MQISRHIPAYPLAEYIAHMVHVSGALPISHLKELPDGGINLVIELNERTVNTVFTENNYQGRYEMKNAWISGFQKQAVTYQNNANSTVISVRFAPGGFFALTGIPVSALDHVGTEAEAILGNSFRHLYQNLINVPTVADMFNLIEHYFLQYSLRESVEHSVVKFIDRNIEKPIDWIIGKSGYSQKHVIHLLKKHTGFSPKYLQRIKRFQSVLQEIQQCDKIDWFSTVHRCGYFDQAHLIKDFSHFAGISPTDYVRSKKEIAESAAVSDMIFLPPSY